MPALATRPAPTCPPFEIPRRTDDAVIAGWIERLGGEPVTELLEPIVDLAPGTERSRRLQALYELLVRAAARHDDVAAWLASRVDSAVTRLDVQARLQQTAAARLRHWEQIAPSYGHRYDASWIEPTTAAERLREFVADRSPLQLLQADAWQAVAKLLQATPQLPPSPTYYDGGWDLTSYRCSEARLWELDPHDYPDWMVGDDPWQLLDSWEEIDAQMKALFPDEDEDLVALGDRQVFDWLAQQSELGAGRLAAVLGFDCSRPLTDVQRSELEYVIGLIKEAWRRAGEPLADYWQGAQGTEVLEAIGRRNWRLALWTILLRPARTAPWASWSEMNNTSTGWRVELYMLPDTIPTQTLPITMVSARVNEKAPLMDADKAREEFLENGYLNGTPRHWVSA